jgi:prepilin-type N-terminal cleavage/methylation domain-containing protein
MKTTVQRSSKAFTIIELLVVVSIIALLVGILLPAIGKARDQAQLTRSQANIKQISTAVVTYAAEFADRQPTWINDNISTYGTFAQNSGTQAFLNYESKVGAEHPWIYTGFGRSGGVGVIYGWASPPTGAAYIFQPINFLSGAGQGFGTFRLGIFTKAVSTYVNGKMYDPTFYAPKDTAVWNATEQYFDVPDESQNIVVAGAGAHKWSSYCFSAAAMFSPSVFGKHPTLNAYFVNPWTIASGFRSPGMSQASFANLKTHLIEHNQLQGRKKECSPYMAGYVGYDNCTPFFFNHAYNSSPVASFYDGHIAVVGQDTAINDTSRVAQQSGATNHGLYSLNSGLPGSPATGGSYDAPAGGYYMDQGQDFASTSYHVLTIDGIKGRDFVGK